MKAHRKSQRAHRHAPSAAAAAAGMHLECSDTLQEAEPRLAGSGKAHCLATGHYQELKEVVIKIYVFSSIWHKLSSN